MTQPKIISTSSPQYIVATRPSGKLPYRLFLSPITNPIEKMYGHFGVIYIFEGQAHEIDKQTLLKQKFLLTSTEAKLAVALSEGESLKNYAQKNGVSVEAPRYHLKNIFLKTHTKRQTQLIVELLKLFSGTDSA